MKDTLVILGSHPRTRKEFDFARTDCDIWVFNEAISCGIFPRADAVFQMHADVIWKNPNNRNDPHHYGWLKTQADTWVYMQDIYSDVPKSVKYPLAEIVERFQINYFTSSLAYALALAAYNNYARVELYGVEMETNTEYQYQRDGVTLWLGVLKGLGAELDLHLSMFDAPLYGYQGEVAIPYETFDARIDELNTKIVPLEGEYQAGSLMLQRVVGDLITGDVSKDLNEAIDKQIKLSKELGLLDGARFENGKYKTKADAMKATANDYIFSRQEFESAVSKLQELAQNEQTKVNFLSGQAELLFKSLLNSAKGSPKREKLLQAYGHTLGEYLKAHNKAMIYAGASQENVRYMQRLDKGIRAAGGEKSEAVMLEAYHG